MVDTRVPRFDFWLGTFIESSWPFKGPPKSATANKLQAAFRDSLNANNRDHYWFKTMGRQRGKSTAVLAAALSILENNSNIEVVIVMDTFEQGRIVIDRARTLLRQAKYKVPTAKESQSLITLENGSTLRVTHTARPSILRGFSPDVVFLDMWSGSPAFPPFSVQPNHNSQANLARWEEITRVFRASGAKLIIMEEVAERPTPFIFLENELPTA